MNTEKIGYVEAIALITIVISFVTLIFGELVPKRLAITKAESFALFSAPIINTISKIVSPIVKLLSLITTLILKIFKVKDENVEDLLSREDIRLMLKNSQLQGVLRIIISKARVPEFKQWLQSVHHS